MLLLAMRIHLEDLLIVLNTYIVHFVEKVHIRSQCNQIWSVSIITSKVLRVWYLFANLDIIKSIYI